MDKKLTRCVFEASSFLFLHFNVLLEQGKHVLYLMVLPYLVYLFVVVSLSLYYNFMVLLSKHAH